MAQKFEKLSHNYSNQVPTNASTDMGSINGPMDDVQVSKNLKAKKQQFLDLVKLNMKKNDLSTRMLNTD